MSDNVNSLGDDSRAMQRANARNQLNEAYEKLQGAAQGFIGTYMEITEGLGLEPSPRSGEAFEALAIAITRSYDAPDDELNADQQREQLERKAT